MTSAVKRLMDITQDVNKALEIVGSAYRAHNDALMSDVIAAFMVALPSYIDRKIDERLRVANQVDPVEIDAWQRLPPKVT
jgi:hypothetical protein